MMRILHKILNNVLGPIDIFVYKTINSCKIFHTLLSVGYRCKSESSLKSISYCLTENSIHLSKGQYSFRGYRLI